MRCCISNDAFIIARLYSDDDFDARVEGDHAQHSHTKSTEHHKSASAVMTNTPAANRRPGHLVAFFYDENEENALQNERESLRV